MDFRPVGFFRFMQFVFRSIAENKGLIDYSSPCLSIQTWYNGAQERDTMSPIEVPAKIQLVEKRETRTSRGMLSKGWYQEPPRPADQAD